MHLFCCNLRCFHLGPSTLHSRFNSWIPLTRLATFLQFSARTFYAGKLLGDEWLESWNVRPRIINTCVPWCRMGFCCMFCVHRPLQRTPKHSLLEALTHWLIDAWTTGPRLKSGIKNEDRKQIRGAVGLVKIRLPRKCDKKQESTKCMFFCCLPCCFRFF